MRAAVLGSPVRHSLSPVLHRAAYAELGLVGWHYDAHECAESGLAGFLAGCGDDWAGLSLTMPLKRVALRLADEASDLATATGAANTLVLRDGRRRADNTDVAGIVAALREAGNGSAPARRAVLLGAGGTAQAALAALDRLGVDDVTVLVRAQSRAGDLHAAAERLGVRPRVRALLTDPAAAAAALTGADVVVSTLPAGAADALLAPGPTTGPTAGPTSGPGPGSTVLDVVYAPWPTPFAAAARARGARVVSGLEMLLHQAVAQVALMTGRPGPVPAMRAALDAAVAARG